ncbi:MAG: xanthine dehydrogenase family protein molybdopterin-binding subunit [Nitrososphaerota archaeon]|nr:xanthine dehydrogenase family protein molybdopterin-binding subunit [Nitrososphaerota archaeon]
MTEEIIVTRQQASQAKSIGTPVRRIEDLQILQGKAGYTDDFEFADQHHAAILTSPYAHAKIRRIDVSKALSLPGVVYVLTGEEVAVRTKPMIARAAGKSPTSHYIMAVGKVRYVGEPVAAVVAKDKYTARDAVELIEVEYEPLPVVASIAEALKPKAPLIYEELGKNEVVSDRFVLGSVDEAFKAADEVVKERLEIQRYASTPLETFVVNSFFDESRDELTVYANDQQPGRTVPSLERTIGIPAAKIHLYVPVVGGGFGYKLAIWHYAAIISLLSVLTGKPVKWVQTRMESLFGYHRPSGYMDAELALSRQGKILGMRLHEYAADANWPYVAGLYPLIKFANMNGLYKIPCIEFEYHCIATNLPPVVQDRGVGKPFMSFVLERLVDLASKRLGKDPFEFRLSNIVPESEMPYTTPSGEVYESGRYALALQRAIESSKYREMRAKQTALRKEGRYFGIGISCGIEPGTSNLGYYYLSKPGTPDFNGAGQMATIELIGGTFKVEMNGPEIGTGHVTTIAQVVADLFGVSPMDIVVDPRYDSKIGHLAYAGTYSNAFNDVYLGAVVRASNILKSKILRLASHELKADPKELELAGGFVQHERDPSKRLSFKEISVISYNRLLSLPEGEEPGLRVVAGYTNRTAKPFKRDDFNVQLTHSYSVHVVLVEVDVKTGFVRIPDYFIEHDAGSVINPGIVEGLAIGSTASGIGGALYEEFVFDENANNLSVTFGEYLKPTTLEIPDIRVEQMETPAPTTVLGTKAVAEGGAITSLAAIANGVEDALTPFGAKVTKLPLTPEVVLRLIKGKKIADQTR